MYSQWPTDHQCTDLSPFLLSDNTSSFILWRESSAVRSRYSEWTPLKSSQCDLAHFQYGLSFQVWRTVGKCSDFMKKLQAIRFLCKSNLSPYNVSTWHIYCQTERHLKKNGGIIKVYVSLCGFHSLNSSFGDYIVKDTV